MVGVSGHFCRLTGWCVAGLLSAGLLGLFLLSLALVGAQALTPSHHLSLSDVARLHIFLSQSFTDLESAYYSIVGLTKLGANVADQRVRTFPNCHSSFIVVGMSEAFDCFEHHSL